MLPPRRLQALVAQSRVARQNQPIHSHATAVAIADKSPAERFEEAAVHPRAAQVEQLEARAAAARRSAEGAEGSAEPLQQGAARVRGERHAVKHHRGDAQR